MVAARYSCTMPSLISSFWLRLACRYQMAVLSLTPCSRRNCWAQGQRRADRVVWTPWWRGYLGLSLDKSLQESDWTGALTAAQLAYAARDAAVLLPLAEKLAAEIATAGLAQVAEIEMRACPALAWLEAAGVPLDPERWRERAAAERRRARDLEQQLAALA